MGISVWYKHFLYVFVSHSFMLLASLKKFRCHFRLSWYCEFCVCKTIANGFCESGRNKFVFCLKSEDTLVSVLRRWNTTFHSFMSVHQIFKICTHTVVHTRRNRKCEKDGYHNHKFLQWMFCASKGLKQKKCCMFRKIMLKYDIMSVDV